MGFEMLLLCFCYGYTGENTAVVRFLLPVHCLSVLFIAQRVQICTAERCVLCKLRCIILTIPWYLVCC